MEDKFHPALNKFSLCLIKVFPITMVYTLKGQRQGVKDKVYPALIKFSECLIKLLSTNRVPDSN